MFNSEIAIDLFTLAGEPGHEARFRAELDQASTNALAVQPDGVPGERADLILARHLVIAGSFIRFV